VNGLATTGAELMGAIAGLGGWEAR
jgi:hypothetical protein